LGRTHELLLGKHSGTNSLQTHLRDHGVTVTRQEASSMLPRLRQFVTDHKRSPSLAELKLMRPSAAGPDTTGIRQSPPAPSHDAHWDAADWDAATGRQRSATA
jgi:hypothetical protein